MQKRMIVMAAAALLAGQAYALPVEAIGSFFAKIFKGGAAKEAAGATALGTSIETLRTLESVR